MAETTASDLRLDMHPKFSPPAASSQDATKSPPENEPGRTGAARFCFKLCLFIFNAVRPLIILLFWFIRYLYWLLSQLLFIEDVSLPVRVAEHPDPKSGDTSVDLLSKVIDNLVNERKAAAKWRGRILMLLLLSLVIVVSVPGLKLIKVLGLPLWKWMVMVALVILSYHYISLLGKRIVKILDGTSKEDNYDVVYYADGLRRSVNNVISCVFILLAWELYFRSSRHGLRRYGVSERAIDIGTGTAVSLLVFAFLLLAKNALILSWESRVIYRQFTDNIGKVVLQLYFLGLISGEKFDIFSRRKEKIDKADKFISRCPKLDGVSNDVSTYRKKKIAKYFILAAKSSSRKDDDVLKKIRDQWKSLKPKDDSDYITKESVLKNVIENKKDLENKKYEQVDRLFEMLNPTKEHQDMEQTDDSKDKKDKNEDKPNEESKGKKCINAGEDQNSSSEVRIPYTTLEEWMEKAFKNCLLLGYTLKDVEGVVDNLNNIIRVFFSIVVFLCWLLLTSIVSTKALITIASPFIAITFIFGDTLKAVFEGIIFTFVTHPFIIGDLCIIDDTQLEVKQMNVLKTTFHKVNTEDEVLYPNKVLAKKAIFNLKGNTDGRDCVQLSLDKSVDIKSLENEIKKFFKKNKDKFEKESVMMTMEEIGETIKMSINFNHSMNLQDDTHGQCFKKKKKQRSNLLKTVFEYVRTKESSSTKNMPNSSGSETCKIA